MNSECTSHCFALRHTSAFSSQLLLQLSPQPFSNSPSFVRNSGGGSCNKQQEIVWSNHHHISKGDRSPAPTSMFKKEPENNLSVPWWHSDYTQHAVIHHNDKIYYAIIKDESTPCLLQVALLPPIPSKAVSSPLPRMKLPQFRIMSQIYSPVWHSYTSDDLKKLKIDNP